MKKSIISVLLALTLCFARCSVPNDGKQTQSSEGTETTAPAEETTEKAETTAAKPEEPKEDVKVTNDIHALSDGKVYTAKAEVLFTFSCTDSTFGGVQGGYFDGDQFIVAMTKITDGVETVRLLVLDKTGKTIRESDPLPLDHANNLTFNPDKNVLVVSHCQPYYNRYSFVDLKDFTILETKDLEYPFFSMAYSPEMKQYASGEWNGQTLDLWDENLKPIRHTDVTSPNTTSQGVFCDKEGIYFVRSFHDEYPSEIRYYDWKCRLRRVIQFDPLEHTIEPESINIVNGETYIIGNNWDVPGQGVCYKLTYHMKEN